MIAGTYVCHMADKITWLSSSIGELFAFFYKLQSYGEYWIIIMKYRIELTR